MNRISTSLFVLIGLILFTQLSFGQTYYRSNATTVNWATAASWQSSADSSSWVTATDYPGQSANNARVLIQNGHTVTLNVAPTNSIQNLTVGSGTSGAYTTDNTNRTINVLGKLVVATGGSLNLNRSVISVTGSTFVNGTMTDGNDNGSNTFNGLFTVNGSFSTANTSAFNFGGGIINNGTFDKSGTGLTTFTASQSLSGANAITFAGNVLITGASTVTNSNTNTVTITGTLDGNNAASTWLNGNGSTLNYGNGTQPFATLGVLDASTVSNTINYNGNVAQTVRATTYHNLGINGTLTAARIKSLNGATIVNGSLSIVGTSGANTSTLQLGANSLTTNGTITVGANGILNDNSATGTNILVGSVTIDVNGSWINSNSPTYELRGGFTNNGTFTSSAGAYTFSTNAQSLSGANAITFAGNVLISGAVTLTNSSSNTVTITGTLDGNNAASTWLNGNGSTLNYNNAVQPFATLGVLNAATISNTVNYNLDNTQAIRGTVYHNLALGNATAARTKTAQGNITVNNDLTVSTNNTLNLGTVGTAFTITGTSTIAGSLDFSNTVIKTVSLNGNVAATGSIILNGLAGHIINFGGANNSVTTFTTLAGNTINYNRTGAQQIFASANYRTLNIAGSGVKSLQGTTSVSGVLTVGAGAELNLNSNGLTSTNTSIVNNGTLRINQNATLTVATGTTITNTDNLILVGTAGNLATITSAGTYQVSQSTGVLSANFYNLTNGNISVSGGTIDNTNNLSNGNFSNSSTNLPQFIDLTGLSFANFTVNNVTFGVGSTNNIRRSSGSGIITVNGGDGVRWGAAFENDGGNLINWDLSNLTFYSQGTGSFGTLSNWNSNPVGGGTNPTATQLTNGVAKFIVQNANVVTINQNIDVLTLSVNNGTLTIGNDATVRTVTVRDSLITQAAGTINTGSTNALHNLTFTGLASTILNNGAINLRNTAVQATNVTNNTDVNILGSNIVNFNDFTIPATRTLVTTTTAINLQGNVVLTGTWNAGSLTHTIAGNWSQAGTLSGLNTINFNASAAQSILTASTFNNVTVSGTGGVIATTANLNINGNLSINASASLTVASNNLTVTGTSNISGTLLDNNNAGTTTLTGLTTVSGLLNTTAINTAANLVFGGGLVVNTTTNLGAATFNANQSITGASALSFANNVLITGASTVTNSNTNTVTITGTLDGNNAASTWLNGNGSTLNYGNGTQPFATLGVLNASTVSNTINYNGNVDQTVRATTYHNLGINGTLTAARIKSLNGATIVNGSLSIVGTSGANTSTLQLGANSLTTNGTITVGANGILNDNSATGTNILVGSVTIDVNGSWINSNSPTYELRGGFTNNGTFTSSAGAYTFSTNAQSLSGANAITFAGNVLISGAVTLTNSSSNTVTITGTLDGNNAASTWLNGNGSTLNYNNAVQPFATLGVLNAATISNTVNYNLDNTQAIRGTVYHNLALGNATAARTKTAQGNITVNNDLTVSTNNTLNLGTVGTAFTITGTSTIAGSLDFSNTVIKTVSLNGNVAATGSIILNGLAGHIINFGGANNSVTTFTTLAGNTINYNRTGAQQIFASANYRTLNIAGSGVKSLQGTTSVSGVLTVGAGAELNLNSNGLTSTNTSIVNNGTLRINQNATLTVATGTTITNTDNLILVGTAGNLATITSAGTYQVSQSTGVLSANFYNLTNGNISVSGGTIDNTNNLSNGNFSNSSTNLPQFIDLTGLSFANFTITNTNFGNGATFNISRTAGVGVLSLDGGNGAKWGEGFDNDNGNPGSLIEWINSSLTFYSQANGLFSSLANWNTSPSGVGSNPVAGDLTSGAAIFVVQNAHVITLDQNADVLELNINNGSFVVGNNATARILSIQQRLRLLVGTALNVGAFSATHTININGNIINDGNINLYNNSGQLVNTVLGSVNGVSSGTGTFNFGGFAVSATRLFTTQTSVNILGNVSLSGTWDAGALTHNLEGNWSVTGGNLQGSNTIRFRNPITQSIATTGTFNNVTFDGNGTTGINGATTINGNVIIDNASSVNAGNFLVTIKGNFTIVSGTYGQGSNVTLFDAIVPQTITAVGATFNDVTFDNSIKTITGGLTTNGTLYVTNDGTINGSGNHTLFGDLRMEGTCNFSGQITFTKTTTGLNSYIYDNLDQNLSLGTANIIIDCPVGSYIRVTNTASTVGQTLNVGGNLTITQGELLIENGSIVNGTSGRSFIMNGTAGQQTVRMRGTNNFPNSFGTYSLNSFSRALYQANIDQSIRGGVTYGGLLQLARLSGTGGTKTAIGSLDMNGNLQLDDWTFTFDMGAFSHTLAGDFVNTVNNAVVGTGTLTLDNDNLNQTIQAGASYNLNNLSIIQNSPTAARTKTISSPITLTGNFSATNPGGSAIELLIVSIGANAISGTGVSNSFVLGSNVRLNTSLSTGASSFRSMMQQFESVNMDVNSTVRYNRNGDQDMADVVYGNIELDQDGDKIAFSNLDINGSFLRTNNTPVFVDGGFSHTIAGNWGLNTAYYPSPTLGATITLDGNNQNVVGSNFPNLVIANSGTKTITSNTTTILGNLTINNGVTYNADIYNINLRGNWNNSGTGTFINSVAGTVTFNGNSSSIQTITSNVNNIFNNITINRATSAIKTVRTLNNLNIDGSVLVTGSGSDFDFANLQLNVANNWTVDTIAFINATGSTVTFDGGIDQDIMNGIDSLTNVIFTNSGTKRLVYASNNYAKARVFHVNGNFDNQGSTVDANSFGEDITVGGNWTNLGSFETGNRYVSFRGANQTIGTTNFYNLFIAGTNIKTLSGNISAAGSLTITSTLDVSPSNYGVSVGINWNNNTTGYFEPRLGTVTFDGANGAAVFTGGVVAGKKFYNLTVNKSATASLEGNLKVDNNLTISTGTLRTFNGVTPYNVTVSGNFVNSGVFAQNNNASSLTLDAANGVRTFDPGTSATNDFRDLIINAGASTLYNLSNNLLLTNSRTLVINSGTLKLNAKVLSLDGGLAGNKITLNGGTLDVDAGSIVYLGNSNVIFNNGGILKVVGTTSSLATISRSNVATTGYVINQLSGTLNVSNAKFDYLNFNTTGTGISISPSTTLIGNFNGCSFNNGFTNSISYIDFGFRNSFGADTAYSVVFNSGPVSNVRSTQIAPTSNFTFKDCTGGLAGELYDNDIVPNNATNTGAIRWFSSVIAWDGGSLVDNTDWNIPDNWSNNLVPTSADKITLDHSIVTGSYNVNVKTADANASQLIISNTGLAPLGPISLNLQNGFALNIANDLNNLIGNTIAVSTSENINIGGNWLNAGTFNSGLGTVNFNALGGSKSITSGGSAFYNFGINAPSTTYTLTQALVVNNNFSLTDGTLDVTGGDFPITCNGNWTVSSPAIFVPRNGLVTLSKVGTSTQNVSNGPFFNLTTSNTTGLGTKLLSQPIIVGGTLTIGANTEINAGTNQVSVAGNWTNNGGISSFIQSGTSSVVFNGTGGTQLINNGSSATTFNNVILSNGANKTFSQNSLVNGNVTVSSGSGTVDLGVFTITGVGASNQFNIAGATTMILRGTNNFPIGFEIISLANTSTVRYQSDNNQIIFPTTYGNLDVRRNTTLTTNKQLGGNIVVAGGLNINDITTILRTDSLNANITLAGNLALPTGGQQIIWGTGTSTLTHNGGNWNIDGDITGFNNLVLNNSGNKAMFSNLSLTGNFTINSGLTFVMNTFTMTGLGSKSLVANGDISTSIPATTGVAFPTGFGNYSLDPTKAVFFNSATGINQTLYSIPQYGAIFFNNTKVVSSDGLNDLIVKGTFSTSSSTFVDGGRNIIVSGSCNLTNYIPSSCTISLTLDGGSQNLSDPNGDNIINVGTLILAGSGTKTLGDGNDAIEIRGNFINNSGVTCSSGRNISFAGQSWTNNGVYSQTAGVLTFNRSICPGGVGTQTIRPGTAANHDFFDVAFNGIDTVKFISNGGDFNGNNFTLGTNAIVNMGSLSHTITATTITNGGNWITANANLTFDRNGGQTIPSFTARNVIFAVAGTKTLAGPIAVDALTINSTVTLNAAAGTNNIFVKGNWLNSGTYTASGNHVYFNGSAATVSITSGGSNFYKVSFIPTAATTYNLLSTSTRFAGDTVLVGSNATLNVANQTLLLSSNLGVIAGKLVTINGTLNVSANGILRVNNQNTQTVINVGNGGSFRLVGTIGNNATLTTDVATGGALETQLNILSGATIHARNYLIEYLSDYGLDVQPGSFVDATNNFSDGTWSNMRTGGTPQRWYLRYNTDNVGGTITNVTFNFSASPVINRHFNVRRDNIALGLSQIVTFGDPLAGSLGSFQYEYDDATYPVASFATGNLRWPIPTLVTWVGSISTDWADANNWSPITVPTSLSDVQIPAGTPNNPIIQNADAFTKNLTITNGTLAFNNGFDLDVNGNLVIGTLTNVGALIVPAITTGDTIEVGGSFTRGTNGIFTPGSSTVIFNSSAGTATITPLSSQFNNVVFDNGSTSFILAGASYTVNGNFIIKAGSVTNNTANYNMNVAGNMDATNGRFQTTTAGTIILNGANQSIDDFNFNNLTVSGTGVKTFLDSTIVSGAVIVNSNLTSAAGAILDLNGNVTINTGATFNDGGGIHNFSGATWTGTGNYLGNGTVMFDRVTGNQAINASKFNNLLLTGSSNNLVTIQGNTTLTGNMTVNNTINTLIIAEPFTVTALVDTCRFTLEAGEFMYVRGLNSFPANFASYDMQATSRVYYDGLINQNVYGGVTYPELYFANATTKTLNGNIAINGSINFNAATFDVSTNDYNMDVLGSWNNTSTGTFVPRNGYVIFKGSQANQIINVSSTATNPFYGLTVDKTAGQLYVNKITTVQQDLLVDQGTFNANGYNIFVGGDLENLGGSIANSGTYTMNNATGGASLITGGSTIPNLIINTSNNSAITLQDNIYVIGDFQLLSGRFNGNGKTIRHGDNGGTDAFNVNGYFSLGASGTLELTGSTVVNVGISGTVDVAGSSTNSTTVTNSVNGGRYSFLVNGTIKSRYTLFQFMDVNGINLSNTAIIDLDSNFSYSSFTNGANAGVYLRINNNQKLTNTNRITDVSFPLNPGGASFNVAKSVSLDTIEFYNSTGSFAGESFDNDPNELVIWTGPITLTWNGSVDTDWFKVNNWTASSGPQKIPTLAENVVIPSGPANQPIIVDNVLSPARAKNLTTNTGSFLTLNSVSAGIDLDVDGDMLLSGFLATNSSNDEIIFGGNWIKQTAGTVVLTAGTVTSDATTPKTINNGTGQFNNFVSNSTSTLALGANTTFNGNLTINSGSFSLSASDLVVRGSITNSGSLLTSTRRVTLSATTGTHSINLGGATLYDLDINNAGSTVYNILSDFTVTRNLFVISSTTSLNFNSRTITIGNSGFVSINGQVSLNNSSSLKMGSGSSISVNSGGGISLVGTTRSTAPLITNSGSGTFGFVINNGATIAARFYEINNLNASGLFIRAGATINTTNNLSFGEFNNGTTGGTYLNIETTLGGGSGITVDSVVFNSGALFNVTRTIGSGVLTMNNSAGIIGYYINEKDDLFPSISASAGLILWIPQIKLWVGGTSGVETNWHTSTNWAPVGVPVATEVILIPVTSFNPIISNSDAVAYTFNVSNGATVQLSNNRNLNVGYDFSNSGTFTVPNGSASTITVGNLFTNTGTFNSGNSSTVILTATSGNKPILPGLSSFNNLTINGAATHQLTTQNLVVKGNLTIQSGTLRVTSSTRTITVSGNWSRTGGSYVNGSGTVTFDKASGLQTISGLGGETFYIVNFNNAGTKTLNSNISTFTFNINNTGRLDAGSFTINVAGNWTNQGSFIAGTSTVNFNATAGTQTINDLGTLNKDFYNLTKSSSATLQLLVNVRIKPLGTLTLAGGSFNLNNKTLFLSSTAAGTARLGVITGGTFANASNFTVERFIPAKRATRYLSSPVLNATVQQWRDSTKIFGPASGGFDTPNSSASTLRVYSENGSTSQNFNFKSVSSVTAALDNRLGYSLFVTGKRTTVAPASQAVTLRLKGIPVTGNINFNVTFTGAAYGWNLVGNPYASQIDWNSPAWTKTNLDNVIYVWDPQKAGPGANYSYNGNTFVSSDGRSNPSVIASSQGFFVRTTASSPVLRSTENVKSALSHTGNFRTMEPENLIRIKFSKDSISDFAVIHSWDGASIGYESRTDASKLFNPGVNISSKVGDNDMSINAIPSIIDTFSIPLNVASAYKGSHKISFVKASLNSNYGDVYLLDKLTNTYLKIEENLEYVFDVTTDNKTVGAQRFVITNVNRQETITDIGDDLIAPTVAIYPNPVLNQSLKLRLVNFKNDRVNVTVIGVDGKVYLKKQFKVGDKNDLLEIEEFKTLNAGIYVLNLSSEGFNRDYKVLKIK